MTNTAKVVPLSTPQKAPAKKSREQWVAELQAQLSEGRKANLNIIFAGLDERLKKSLYLAAHLSKAELTKPINELTGSQRHQVFIALQKFEQLIVQMQKSGLFNLTAFNIGQLAKLEPAEQAEIDRIQKLKQIRYAQQRQQYEQHHGITEQPKQAQG